MTKKAKSAELVKQLITAFKCPICESSVKVMELKSLVCTKNHTFDFAKQGYLNLLTHPSKSQYNKDLFEARHKIIMESNLYTPMHEAVIKVINEYLDMTYSRLMVADLGCGEGSHLQKIIEGCKIPAITGIGIDISKEGIALAAKKYDHPIWLVGDLAKSPLVDKSLHVILNILSPSNYLEFKRILVEEGLIIKVIPRSNYLKELRDAFFDNKEKKAYNNNKIVTLFKKHFHLLDVIKLNYVKNMNTAELKNLVKMTPLAWSADKNKIEQFICRDSAQITVDLDILVGLNKLNIRNKSC